MLHSFSLKRKGFTLVELVVVVAILAILAVFASSRVVGVLARGKEAAAVRDLHTIRAALVSDEGGYVADMRGIPGFSLAYLRIANLLMPTNLYGEVLNGTGLMRGFQVDREGFSVKGCAPRDEFVRWNPVCARGWRGPYVKAPVSGFPQPESCRFLDDASFRARGFYPNVSGLRLPSVFSDRAVSVYGFPGEPAIMDPWGNPYVLQIPPAQAFSPETATNIPDVVRFRFARLVSAGPDGRLSTPCYTMNETNDWREIGLNWRQERVRRLSRQAGLIDGGDRSRRGDDLVLFLTRNDVDEGERL